VVRLARIAREIGAGAVRILADDPIAPGEIEQLCAERGWDFARDPQDPAAFNVLVR
jgi:tRNA 2-thiouridine synthesizing protein A